MPTTDSKWDLPIKNKGKFKSYTNYKLVTASGSKEKAILNSGTYKGTKYTTTTDPGTGIRMVDNCYCVALGTYFTKGKYSGCGVGSKFLITTSTGKQYSVIQCDTKANKDTDISYHIYTTANNCITEFYYEKGKMPNKVAVAGSYGVLDQFSGYIVNVQPLSNDATGTNTTIDSNTNNSGSTIGEHELDREKLNPLIVTIDRNSIVNIDFDTLKKNDVVGVMIEAGYLYNSNHIKQSRYRNPRIDDQVKAVNRAGLSYALYAITRAKTTTEAKEELVELSFVINKYPPLLGVWIDIDLKSSIAINDRIVNTYKDYLVGLGLKSKIGIYATKSQLSKITWTKHCNDWSLWWVSHTKDMKIIDEVWSPEFFMLDDGVNKPVTAKYVTSGDDYQNPTGNYTEGVTGILSKPTKTGSYVSKSFPNYSDGSWHGGYDISVSTGTPVYAADGGVVYKSADITSPTFSDILNPSRPHNGGYYSYGRYVIVKCKTSNDHTYYMYYCHLSSRSVKQGDKINKGDLIGKSGNTGHSYGAHLHFEIRRDNDSHKVISPYDNFGKNYQNAKEYK